MHIKDMSDSSPTFKNVNDPNSVPILIQIAFNNIKDIINDRCQFIYTSNGIMIFGRNEIDNYVSIMFSEDEVCGTFTSFRNGKKYWPITHHIKLKNYKEIPKFIDQVLADPNAAAKIYK